MKLVASMLVAPVEVERYLYPCVASLLSFCDRVMLLSDGVIEVDLERWGDPGDRIRSWWLPEGSFYAHEGKARQRLLDLTLQLEPTHILSVDADEFVTDGQAVRGSCESGCPTFTLDVTEVWQADAELRTRQDGGWATREAPILYAVPDPLTVEWRMPDMALASGREPEAVRALYRRDCTEPSGATLLHFGWANKAERTARYQRYVDHDGGRFHNRKHLDSIMWSDDRVTLEQMEWPEFLLPWRDAIREIANRP